MKSVFSIFKDGVCKTIRDAATSSFFFTSADELIDKMVDSNVIQFSFDRVDCKIVDDIIHVQSQSESDQILINDPKLIKYRI